MNRVSAVSIFLCFLMIGWVRDISLALSLASIFKIKTIIKI
jgi:hypothetical protein